MKKAIFIDRDGTLNEMVYDETHGTFDSPKRPEQMVIRPGAAEFLRTARECGWFVVVVTNQPGLAKGTLTIPELDAVHARLSELLTRNGGGWDRLVYCPHHPTGRPGFASPWVMDCECRKPKPGLLKNAASEWGLDLTESWMIGDGLVDVQAGHRAGCRTALIASLKTEHLEKLTQADSPPPTLILPSLRDAIAPILRAGPD